jgi:D-hexose-6-phosphate mutarotase
MSDLGDPAWNGMVCIETANAGPDKVTLEPGATHRLEALISLENTAD